MLNLNRHKLFLVLVDITGVLVVLALGLLIVVNSTLHARIEADLRILSSARVAQVMTSAPTLKATATTLTTVKPVVVYSTPALSPTIPSLTTQMTPRPVTITAPISKPVVKVVTATLPTAAPIVTVTGPRIVFRLDNGTRGQIYVMNADGSGLIDLSNDSSDDSDPVWSPDHQWIAYTAVSNGRSQIRVMAADGSHQHNVSGMNTADRRPTWSPDGTHLMFVSDGASPLFCIMGADGSDRHPFKG